MYLKRENWNEVQLILKHIAQDWSMKITYPSKLNLSIMKKRRKSRL